MTEVHIWLDKIGFDEYESTNYMCNTWAETMVLIKGEFEVVHTTQTHFCHFQYGKLFVHYKGEMHEITVGECEGTNREILEGHDIEKMLFAGEFEWFKG